MSGNGSANLAVQFDAAPTWQGDNPLDRTMVLDVDVPWQAQRVTKINLKEPTAGQYERALRELESGHFAHTIQRYKITLIAQVSNMPREVIERLRASDVEKAYVFLAPLLPGFQATSESSQQT
jgi:hypothetical protein